MEGRIELLLTKLLGGHFGATLTTIDFFIRATLITDLAGLFWACIFDICTLSLSLSHLLEYPSELLKNNKKI